ncbi:alpha/beta hydrolase [Parachlamydia sp. AcF125]|uniref:alpha/beta hydrolase n=1 Tax=Parachlamydia sp. AcF125 TaxID=2795736 RepID=UPI001BC9E1E9|nr:alpha/beta hydrolase [Parachlamydia sp. AcF125]MBS4168631.1 hypothetical protein [Parachlamydia sp. AcF125]
MQMQGTSSLHESYPYPDSDSDSEEGISKLFPISDSPPEHARYLISDRANFENRYEFSPVVQIMQIFIGFTNIKGQVPSCSKQEYLIKNVCEYENFDLRSFSDCRVLILIHGFTVDYQGALEMLWKVSAKAKKCYDVIIGYLYPACAKVYEYTQAEKNGLRAAEQRLPPILSSIRSVAKQVDIAAHSLGTVVAMHALNQSDSPRIDNLFLLGGAIEETSIFECDDRGCTTLKQALFKAKKIYVFYSCKDKVLPWRRLVDPSQPLGILDKAVQQYPIAKNVCLIDATPVVKGHRAYFDCLAVYKFFKLIVKKGVRLQHTSFSLTKTELISSEEPTVCVKGGSKNVTTGMFKKIVSFKFKRDKRADDKALKDA